MARRNREGQADRRHLLVSPAPSANRHPGAIATRLCPQSRALLLALVLVSCLISINCASYQEQLAPVGQVELEPLGRSQAEELGDELAKGIYQLAEEKELPHKSPRSAAPRARLTTLVENELEEKEEKEEKEVKEEEEDKKKSQKESGRSFESPASSTSASTTSPAPSLAPSSSPAPAEVAQPSASALNDLYQRLLAYLPFLARLGGQQTVVTNTTDAPPTSQPAESSKLPAAEAIDSNTKRNSTSDNGTSTSVRPAGGAQASNEKRTTGSRLESTKHDVSTLVDADEAASVRDNNDKQAKRLNRKDIVEPSDEQDSYSEQRQRQQPFGGSISVSGPIEEVKIRHRMPVVSYESTDSRPTEHKVSLARQSSLLMPLSGQDELLVGNYASDQSQQPQRLRLDGLDARTDDLGTQAPAGPVSQRSNSRRPLEDFYHPYAATLHQRLGHPAAVAPGDGSAGYWNHLAGMGGVGGNLSGPNGGNNDVYFLVMVASFCGMAMAVVLAAGLFAYRVQQSRKSACDSDYPTYGVVGPNNLNAKCIAGAGPYLASYPGGGGSSGCPGALSPASGKLGGLKGPLEGQLYGPSGSTSADSGLAASRKGAGKRGAERGAEQASSANGGGYGANQNAARMYHYQHQKQQMISSDRTSGGRHTSASDLDSDEDVDEGNYTVFECSGLASAHDMEIKNPLFNEAQSP